MAQTARILSALLVLGAAQESAAQRVPHRDVRKTWEFLLVPVAADGCPLESAGAPYAELATLCVDFQEKARKGPLKYRRKFADLAKECDAKYREAYFAAVTAKYTYADFGTVVAQIKAAGVDASKLECLLAASHNARLNAEIEQKQAERDALERQINAQADETDAEIARLEAEIARPAPEPGPSGLQMLGRVLQGMGQGLTSASGHANVTPGNPSSAPGCTSDYACGVGFVCVKENYSAAGYCAKSVNAYGVQQFGAPSPGSVGVKTPSRADCRFDTDCPPGFRCEVSSGACVR